MSDKMRTQLTQERIESSGEARASAWRAVAQRTFFSSKKSNNQMLPHISLRERRLTGCELPMLLLSLAAPFENCINFTNVCMQLIFVMISPAMVEDH